MDFIPEVVLFVWLLGWGKVSYYFPTLVSTYFTKDQECSNCYRYLFLNLAEIKEKVSHCSEKLRFHALIILYDKHVDTDADNMEFLTL